MQCALHARLKPPPGTRHRPRESGECFSMHNEHVKINDTVCNSLIVSCVRRG